MGLYGMALEAVKLSGDDSSKGKDALRANYTWQQN